MLLDADDSQLVLVDYQARLMPVVREAIAEAGDKFEALVVSDQPMDQPKKYALPHSPISLS